MSLRPLEKSLTLKVPTGTLGDLLSLTGKTVSLTRDWPKESGFSSAWVSAGSLRSLSGISLQRQLRVRDGGTIQELPVRLNNKERQKLPSKRNTNDNRWLETVDFELGREVPTESSQPSIRSIQLTHNGHDFEHIGDIGSIGISATVGATFTHRGEPKQMTHFDDPSWQSLHQLEVEGRISVQGTDVVDWLRREQELTDVQSNPDLQGMVKGIID